MIRVPIHLSQQRFTMMAMHYKTRIMDKYENTPNSPIVKRQIFQMESDFSLPPVVIVRDSDKDNKDNERRQHPSHHGLRPYQRGYGHGHGVGRRPGRHIHLR